MTLLLDTLTYSLAVTILLWASLILCEISCSLFAGRNQTRQEWLFEHADRCWNIAVVLLLLFFLIKPFVAGYVSPI